MDDVIKICKICGKGFSPVHHNSTLCSDECRAKSARQIAIQQGAKRRERTRERLGTRFCKVCGKEFAPKHSQMVMCSKNCNKNKNRINANKRRRTKEAKVQKAIVISKRIEKNEKLVREAVQAKEAGLSYGKAEMKRYLEKQSIEMAIRRKQMQEEWERRKQDELHVLRK